MRFLPFLLILTLVIAACATQQPAPVPPPPASTADQIVVQTQPIVETTGTIAVTQSNATDAQAELDALLNRSVDRDFSVTYTVKVNGSSAGTHAIYVKGESVRIDDRVIVDDQVQESRNLWTPDSYIFCGNEGGWSCFSLPVTNETQAPENMERAPPQGVTVTRLADTTVASNRATCYAITYQNTTSREEECFSKEGILLSSRLTAPDGTLTMTATSYALSVGDVFSPPAEPQAMTQG